MRSALKIDTTQKISITSTDTPNPNDSSGKDTRRSSNENEDDNNDFVMEFEEDDWDSITAPAEKKEASPLKTPIKIDRMSVIKPVKEEIFSARTDERIAREKAISDELEKNKIPIKSWVNPGIDGFLTGKSSISNENFGLKDWADLQKRLKNSILTTRSEFQAKEQGIDQLKKLVYDYASLELQIREKNEIYDKIVRHDLYKEEDIKRVLVKEQDYGLGRVKAPLKELIYLVADNPRIIALIAKNGKETASLKCLEETLVGTLYENVLAEDGTGHDVLRLFADMLQFDMHSNTQKYSEYVKNEDLFFNKLWKAYLKRTECKSYVKKILRDPLLICIKEQAKIKLDPKKIKEDVEKKRNKQQKGSMAGMEKARRTLDFGGKNDSSTNTPSSVNKLKRTYRDYTDVSPPKFTPKKPIFFGSKEQYNPHIYLNVELAHFDESKFEEGKVNQQKTSVDSPDLQRPLGKEFDDKEVSQVFFKSIHIFKRYINNLLRSIFDNLENMPMGVRIFCKIVYVLVKKRPAELQDKDCYQVLSHYLYRKWILPNYTFSGMIGDYDFNPSLADNLMEISKAMQNIFSMELYPAENIRSELNDYIKEIIPSIQNYYKELIAVKDSSLQEVLQTDSTINTNFKLRSIFISLLEIRTLCECILKQKEELKGSHARVVELAEKVLSYDKSIDNVFNVGRHPETNQNVAPSQLYLLFDDVVLPEGLVQNYTDEINKQPAIPKYLSHEEKIVLKAKYYLKNFLIKIHNIQGSLKWSSESTLSLNSILEKYADSVYATELNASQKGDKIPLHIMARFLLSLLAELPSTYTHNNCYKLYHEIVDEYRKTMDTIDASISKMKADTLSGIDSLTMRGKYLQEVLDEKVTRLSKYNFWQMLRMLRVPLCITCPSNMERFNMGNAKKSGWSSDKIEVIVKADKGCIHERMSIMRELATSAGAIAGQVKTKSATRSMSNSGSFSNGGGNGMFDESNYHTESVEDFINLFGKLPEVLVTLRDGDDTLGVNNAIVLFYDFVSDAIQDVKGPLSDEELRVIMDDVESYVCKKLYHLTYPLSQIDRDYEFWRKCKTLEWVDYDHLEIVQQNRFTQMWEHASKVLNQMDNRMTPIEKLGDIMQCFKVITQVLEAASMKEGSGGADDTLPIMIYVILKACPKRMYSNLNFIEFFRDTKKMLGGEGYCFIQTRSAVLSIMGIDHTFLKISKEKYMENVQVVEARL